MTEHSQGGSPYRVGSAPSGVKPPEQPPAPEFDRRMKFHPSQVPGIVLVALLPVLSMFGVFGLFTDRVSTASELVELTVEYSAANRFKVRRPLNIELTNVGPSSLTTVRVALSASYIFAFSDVALTPGPEHIDGDNYYFLLSDIAPGETRTIASEMQAERYWRHTGSVSWSVIDAAGDAVDSGGVEFATMVWP